MQFSDGMLLFISIRFFKLLVITHHQVITYFQKSTLFINIEYKKYKNNEKQQQYSMVVFVCFVYFALLLFVISWL